MIGQRALRLGAIAWAVAGLAVALPAAAAAGPSPPMILDMASVACPLASALASSALARHRDRLAGLLLLISVATPTYFAYALNIPALVVGLALLLAPRWAVRDSHRPSDITDMLAGREGLGGGGCEQQL